jgi:hypothetical protein
MIQDTGYWLGYHADPTTAVWFGTSTFESSFTVAIIGFRYA